MYSVTGSVKELRLESDLGWLSWADSKNYLQSWQSGAKIIAGFSKFHLLLFSLMAVNGGNIGQEVFLLPQLNVVKNRGRNTKLQC